eukprot:g47010.t1
MGASKTTEHKLLRHLVAGDPLYDSSAPLYGSSSMANPGQEGSVVPGRGQQLSFSQACSLIKSPYSCLVLDTCRRHITLSPVFLKRQRSGIEKQLRTELLRFSESVHRVLKVPELIDNNMGSWASLIEAFCMKGVPIAFDKVRLIGELGDIYDDQGYIHLNIEADFVIFRPKTGQKLM